MDILYALLGLTILVLAGDMLVRGAVNVSLRLGVPALIVSLTIVAVGTSAPELLVSVSAVLEDVPGIAVGNVVGSNIANVLLVLGLPAMLMSFDLKNNETRTSYYQMIAGTALFAAMAYLGPITWYHGVLLLAVYAGFMIHAIQAARVHRRENSAEREALLELDEVDLGAPWWKIIGFLLLGIIGLPLGADLLVESATEIARDFNVSETVIGLTLVALGTSLPELATTIAAALRKQADVALGNVLGSNMANLLGIVGAASLFGTIPVSADIIQFDMLIMIAAALVLGPFILFRFNITRIWGVVFTGLYLAYVARILT